MLTLMEQFAVQNDYLSEDEASAWASEQRALAEQGRFFFSLSHFVVSARKAQ